MNTDNDMRAPALEKLAHVADTARMEKLARFRANPVHGPVEVFHPALSVAQDPVVEAHQLRRDFVRLLNRADDTNSVRLAFEKLLHTGHDRRRGRTVAATGVRRDNQDFGNARAKHNFSNLKFQI